MIAWSRDYPLSVRTESRADDAFLVLQRFADLRSRRHIPQYCGTVITGAQDHGLVVIKFRALDTTRMLPGFTNWIACRGIPNSDGIVFRSDNPFAVGTENGCSVSGKILDVL
jgi:hypothetical protein